MDSLPNQNANRPIFSRLRHYSGLRDSLFEALSQAENAGETYSANTDIFKAGGNPKFPLIIESGWAFHYKLLPDGGRQICQLLLPGDIIDGAAILPGGSPTTSVAAVKDVSVRQMDSGKLFRAVADNEKVAAALWWTVVQTDNMFREHITRIGRKSSAEALAHLLLELMVRCELAGITEDGGFRMPLTQNDLGDFLGITPVHISRMLTLLKRSGMITLEHGLVCIMEREALSEFGAFTQEYLTTGFEHRPG